MWPCPRSCGVRVSPSPCTVPILYVSPVAPQAYNLRAHCRAGLGLTASMDRLESVVRSAQNNIIGEPGPYHLDHVFAFTDLGFHLWQLAASGNALGGVFACRALATVAVLVGAVLVAARAIRAVDSRSGHSEERPRLEATPRLEVRRGLTICHCRACRGETAFRICPGGVCALWSCSFSRLLDAIDLCKVQRSE